jgi:hypothetical protein
VGALLATLVAAPQVQIWHFSQDDPISLFATDPNTGDVIFVTGQATPGDFIRRNADGTYFARVSVRGAAMLDIAAVPGGPELVGEGIYLASGSVEPDDPEAPLDGFGLTLDGFVLHIDAALTDPGGDAWRATAQVLARDGEITHFDVEIEPLD